MNHSVLAQQLLQSVSDYLRLSLETTTPFFDRLLKRFLTTPGLLAKVLIYRSNYPLKKGSGKADFFPNVPLGLGKGNNKPVSFINNVMIVVLLLEPEIRYLCTFSPPST
ncbi:MAG: hypothetical protein PHC94_02445 [Methylobacter sp.]|nr:hypothetical protein [Methylococcales bacterium]MDD5112850.1 hypothetical protein [Methylobacter sp.]